MRHINYIYQNPLSRLRPTEHLYDELEHLHMNQAVLRAGDRVYREVTQAIKALRGTLRKLERVNEPIRAKWEMLLDPFRRDKVLHELGGKDALERWEARRTRFWIFGRQTRNVCKDEHEHVDMRDTLKSSSPIPGRRGIKTDSTGRFYLAPAIEPLIYARHSEARVRGDAPVTPRPRPRIPLTPEELRGDVLVGLGAEFDTSLGDRNPSPPASRDPARRPLSPMGEGDDWRVRDYMSFSRGDRAAERNSDEGVPKLGIGTNLSTRKHSGVGLGPD